MRPRSLLAALTALAAVTAGLLTSPADARGGGPIGVYTTITLLKTGAHSVTSRGHAPDHARVVLQDRFNRHQVWSTVAQTRADDRGRFRMTTQFKGPRVDREYRTCVVRPGPDRCLFTGTAKIIKRDGKITLTEPASRVVDYENSVLAKGRLSRFLRGLPLEVQYRDPASGKWKTGGSGEIAVHGALFTINFDGFNNPLGLSKQGLEMQLVARGNAEVRTVREKWTVDAYTRVSLGNLPVVSGAVLKSQVFYAFIGVAPIYSDAVAPAGSGGTVTATVSVPAGCIRASARVGQDVVQTSAGPFTASVTRNATVVYDSQVNGPQSFALDVAGGDQLTLTTSYDAAHPEWRPWFLSPDPPVLGTPRMPYLLCSSP